MLIKQVPEDFKVKEVMNLEFKEGHYFYYLLRKKNWNTLDVVEKLGQFLKTKVGFAGNKDKYAVTEQFISILNVSKKKVEQFHLSGVSLEFIGKGDKPISLGTLKGNTFEITLREVKKELPPVSFIENYFDEQRFGRNNALVGKLIIQRKFLEANKVLGKDIFLLPKKRLRFYFHAYQSYLFNEYLALFLQKNYASFVEKKYSLGELVFVKKFKKNSLIPLVNFDTALDKLYQNVLKKEEVGKKDFLVRELPDLVEETVFRNAFVPVENFKSNFLKKEKRQMVSFSLQKGSYATIVITKMLEMLK